MAHSVVPLTSYRRRVVDEELDELVPGIPAISLEGAKGVGKTATTEHRATTVHRLDDPATAQLVGADPMRLLVGDPPVLIDEWQLFPSAWDIVRRAVDRDPTPGRFLLTGSAAPAGAPTHTGAGRIVRVRMRPMSLYERGVDASVSLRELLGGEGPRVSGRTSLRLDDYVTEILASGFPALRGLPPRALRAQLDGYLQRVIDREFPEQGLSVRHPDTLRAWMRAYAAATSSTASYESIRDAATPGRMHKPARSTTLPYRDVLSRLWLLDPVSAWLPTSNRFAQPGAAEKHQLADPALAARLLGLTKEKLLGGTNAKPPGPRDARFLGPLLEGLVALNLRVYAQACEAEVRHLRTHRGEREVDFVVVGADGGAVAVEVKLSALVTDDDVRHLLWFRRQAADDFRDAVILTTGDQAYRRQDGVAVVPVSLLGP